MAGVAESVMEINSMTPASSMWKLNKSTTISKSLVFVKVKSVKHETGSTIAVIGVLMATIGVESTMVGEAASMMVGEAVSMMIGEAVSMSMGDAESTIVAGDELVAWC
jgi:hypothetical protein